MAWGLQSQRSWVPPSDVKASYASLLHIILYKSWAKYILARPILFDFAIFCLYFRGSTSIATQLAPIIEVFPTFAQGNDFHESTTSTPPQHAWRWNRIANHESSPAWHSLANEAPLPSKEYKFLSWQLWGPQSKRLRFSVLFLRTVVRPSWHFCCTATEDWLSHPPEAEIQASTIEYFELVHDYRILHKSTQYYINYLSVYPYICI